MHKYEVEKLYNPSKTRWQEGVQFNLRGGQAELLLFFENPSQHEILAVKKSECEFGVLAIEDAIFFLYRFGSEIAWSDQPFSIHLVAEAERTLPDIGDGFETRLTMQIILVDARNGKIKAMRLVSLSPEFSQELLKLVREQLEKSFNPADYDRRLTQIYAQYPTTTALLRECFVFTKGGI